MSLQPNEVKTENIASGAVTTPKVGELQITNSKIADGAIKTEKIATGAVTGSKLADNAVTGSKIRDNTVRAEKIAAGAITQTKIGEQQVTGSRIKDNAITSEKIANNAVTTAKILDRSVTPAKLSFTPPSVVRPITPPVSSAELATASVETDKIADGAVTPPKLSFTPATRPLDPPIAEAEIGTYAVTYMKIAPNSVNDEKLSAGAVTPVKLDVTAPATDGQLYSYDSATGKFKPITLPAAGNVLTMFDMPVQVYYQIHTAPFAADIDLSAYVPATAKALFVQFIAESSDNNTIQQTYYISPVTGSMGGKLAEITIRAGLPVPIVETHCLIKVLTPQTMFIFGTCGSGYTTGIKVNIVGYIE